jgi:hypothetical protein
MERDFDYENNNIVYDEQDPSLERGIKCKNYIICEDLLPRWWFKCKGNYLCINCHMMFGTWGSVENTHIGKGTLKISNNLECPICFEIKQCISQPRCEHSVCIDCFKRCYYGEKCEGEPIFPYSDVKDEYYDDQENPKWDDYYPLIKIYNEEHNKWDDKNTEKYNTEEYLRKCSLCRK